MARILLIDDDDALRSVMAKSLTYAGHVVVQAADGRQGLELSRATHIDLVVTDLVMPVQEGVETILKLRREQPTLPVVAISGGVSNSDVYLNIASKIGARRVLPKPFTPQELISLIAELLPQQPAASSDGRSKT
jgi:DNA-binding response OmpR family regulator